MSRTGSPSKEPRLPQKAVLLYNRVIDKPVLSLNQLIQGVNIMNEINNDESEAAKLNAEWERLSDSDKGKIKGLHAEHERLSESDKAIFKKLIAEADQESISETKSLKKRQLHLFFKTIFIVIIIVSAYLINHYDIYQRVFTPKEYWTHKVQSAATSMNDIELVIT